MNRMALLVGGVVLVGSTAMFLLRGQANQVAPEPSTPHRCITAIGSATVTGKPDSARVWLEVVTKAKTVVAAREENARVVTQVQTALLALKLADLKSKTRDSSVSINYYDNYDKTRVVGYEVRQSFSVLVKETNPEKLGATAARILDVGLQNGVNSGGSIEFFKADDSEMKRESMTKAVEDGIANARAYAAGAKLTTVGVAEISGHDFLWGNQWSGGFNGGFGFQGGVGGAGAAPSFVAGDWKVTSQVRVVMRY